MYCLYRLKGFTLIELIVVIALIAVIAAVVAPNLLSKAGEANHKSAVVQLEKISNAVELYRLETGQYPQQLSDLVERPRDVERWNGPYIRKQSQLLDPWGNELILTVPGEGHNFDLMSYGADGRAGGDGDAADITNWD